MRPFAMMLMLTGVLAACTAGGSETESSSPSLAATPSAIKTVTLDCTTSIDALATPPADYTRALDAVAIDTKLLQVSEGGAKYRLFAKTGLLVRAGEESTLSVAGRVAVHWGSQPQPWASTLKIPACPAKGDAQWLIYPGGFTLDEAQCVDLVVEAGGKKQMVSIPVGTACP